ncbi:hypothetical protein RYX36_036232 [Vicia faba]
MASTVASGLTAEAPEFHPTNHVQKLHPPYLTFTPLRHQPSYPFFYYYYPTASKHHFHSFRFHANHPLTTATPAFPPSSGMKNEIAVEAQSSEGNDGEIEDRRSHRLRIPRLEWRKKGGDDAETYPKLKNESFRRNHHKEYVNIQQQHSRASTDGKNKASIFPVVPVRPDGDETTVMIKNVPSKYTRDMIVKFLENHCMKWELFLSHKIRDVVAARLQGKEKLEKHFVSVNFPCESEEVLPLCFSPPRDGVIKGNQRTLGRLLYKSR